MNDINLNNIDKIFHALNYQSAVFNGVSINLVVCGGTALAALGLISRTTKDVDVLGLAKRGRGGTIIQSIYELPDWLEKAAEKVGRDFGLPENWLNLDPSPLFATGLPEGFENRLIDKRYGEYLTVAFISRIDQIHFKLYAAVNRGDYHIQDLVKLKPSDQDLGMAARWAVIKDNSQEFKLKLKDFLNEQGYENIANRI